MYFLKLFMNLSPKFQCENYIFIEMPPKYWCQKYMPQKFNHRKFGGAFL